MLRTKSICTINKCISIYLDYYANVLSVLNFLSKKHNKVNWSKILSLLILTYQRIIEYVIKNLKQ